MRYSKKLSLKRNNSLDDIEFEVFDDQPPAFEKILGTRVREEAKVLERQIDKDNFQIHFDKNKEASTQKSRSYTQMIKKKAKIQIEI